MLQNVKCAKSTMHGSSLYVYMALKRGAYIWFDISATRRVSQTKVHADGPDIEVTIL